MVTSYTNMKGKRKILLPFSLLIFIANLVISIEIVDFIHTVQMQVTWVPGKPQSSSEFLTIRITCTKLDH